MIGKANLQNAEFLTIGSSQRTLDPAAFVDDLLRLFLASQCNGTLYIGVTNDLVRRVYEHREGLVAGFNNKYVKTLVYFETFDDPQSAIAREKQLKAWKRSWKTELIEKLNPYWNDLYADIV